MANHTTTLDINKLKPYLIVVILGLGIYIALAPNIVYAPTPRVVLFFVLSVIPAVLFGSDVASKFDVSLPGFVFTVAGAGAVFFGSLFFLDRLSKPEQQIAVFAIYDENGDEFSIDAPGILETKFSDKALSVTRFTAGNNLVVIFPEQVAEVEILVRKIVGAKPYRGKIKYAGTIKRDIILGSDLLQ
jgi:hypothetical protein